MKARIRDIDVHYEEVGTGRPMLLMHGGGPIGCARWALNVYEGLFAHRLGWRRIYVDQMGHGETPAPPWVNSVDDAVDVTCEFMDAVAPGERFALTGISWGGYLARGVLHHRPQQIDGAFIWEPIHHYPDGDPAIPPQRVFRHEPEFEALAAAGDGWLAGLMIDQTAAAWANVKQSVLAGAANNRGVPAFDRSPGSGFSFDPEDLPEPFPGPVLVLCGRQDNIVGYGIAFASLNRFPRGTHVVLDRSGHFMQVDQPVLVKALANEWLDRVEEYVAR